MFVYILLLSEFAMLLLCTVVWNFVWGFGVNWKYFHTFTLSSYLEKVKQPIFWDIKEKKSAVCFI